VRCPACGYISFDSLESCKRCGRDLAQYKRARGIRAPKPLSVEPPQPAEDLGSAEAALPVSIEEPPSPGAALEPPSLRWSRLP